MKNSAAFFIFCLTLIVPHFVFSQSPMPQKIPNLTQEFDIICKNYEIDIIKTPLKTRKDTTTSTGLHINNFLIYNTAKANDISPGYFYWYNNQWNNLKNIIKKYGIPSTQGNTGDVYVDLSTRDVYVNNGTMWITKIKNDKNLALVKYNSASGLLTYINGRVKDDSINLSLLLPNFGKPNCISMNVSRKTISFIDKNGSLIIFDTRFLKKETQHTSSHDKTQ
ncbi:hypothetical protein [Flavobacterium sp. FlaQc-48]|uniref:hypothetical protein n=1 Tax=Flavobacterium sp. FlaQc-48 TaxID=3374181 RepID=UPI003757B6DC